MDFTDDSQFETFILAYIPLLSIVSLIFSFVAFYLLKKTPKSSDRYKWYLLNLQIWSTLLDAHFGISFVPVPLFPLIAGYCRGLLCVFRFPMHYSLFFLFFLGSEVTFAVILALLSRHQSVNQSFIPRVLSNSKLWKISFLVLLQLMFLIPSISFLSSVRQARNDDIAFLESHPKMGWVTENPQFVFCNGSQLPITFTVNSSGVRKVMNAKTISTQNRLTLVVTLQAITISMVLILPILLYALSVMTRAFPYEVCWVAYCIQLLFTIAHTTVLISMTPSYLSTILAWFNIHQRNIRRNKFPKPFHIANMKYGDTTFTVH